MAITYSLDDYIYGQKLRLYNSERREMIGGSNVVDAEGHQVWENVGATLQKFLFNPSQDVVTPLPLCTFSNGVSIKWTYDSSTLDDPGITSDSFTCSLSYAMYDKDDNVIEGLFGSIPLHFIKQYCSVTDAYFMYSPPYFNYNLSAGKIHPIFFYGGGSTFTPYIYKTLTVYPPDITGDVRTNFGSPGYYWDRQPIVLGGSDFNHWMNLIIDNGDDTPITPKLPEDDTSGPGGGQGDDPDYNPFSDPVNFPDLPTGGSAIATGFIRVYEPSASQLQSLASVLWSDSFIDTIKKIQNDPMEAIISLHSIPVSVAGSIGNCRIGNFDSGVAMPIVNQQYVRKSLGSIYIPEHWASALDYAPYVQVDIFLPYLGVRSLQVDDIVGKTISIEYNIDVLSGACTASIKCGNSVLYSYNTCLINQIPISQSSYGPFYQAVIGAIGNVLSGYGSAGAPGAASAVIGSAVNVAMSKQHSISRGGALGGIAGSMASFTPYLIIHRPIQSLASGFKHFKGYPSNITTTLGSVSGYTEVESIHLNNITCTDSERDEIMAILHNGVIA